MLKTIYLHIGQEKTGTTSIQHFLETNRSALYDQEVYLPSCLGHENHKMLAAYAFNAESKDISVVSANRPADQDGIERFRSSLALSLEKNVKYSEGSKVGIITSEDLSRLFQAEEVHRVIEFLKRFCEEIKVVVFLRRQDLLASSRYYSLVLGGSKETIVLPSLENKIPNYYDYNRNIGLWIDAVGRENVIMEIFPERPKDVGFNSVETFAKVVGLDISKLSRTSEQHVSLDAVNQIIIQHFNSISGENDAVGVENLKAALLQENDRRHSYIPSRHQAEKFYMRFHQGNSELFAKLGVEKQTFNLDFTMYPEDNMRSRYQSLAIKRLLRLCNKF